MLAVRGTYQDGDIKLEKAYLPDKTVKVIVVFLDDEDPVTEQPLAAAEDFPLMDAEQN